MRPDGVAQRRVARALTTVAAIGIVLVAATVASAAFPGRNGLLVLAAPCAHPAPGCHGLEVVQADGRGLRLLCPRVAACGEASAPVWSPDGRRVAFASPQGGLTVVYADGSCLQCQGNGNASVSPGISAATGARAAWKPNGRQLVEPADWMDGALVGDDGLVERLGVPLGSGPVDDFALSTRDVLAYARPTRPRRRDLFLHGPGARPRRLTYAGGDQPSWSPDGRSLAFVRSGDIYLIRADGTGKRLLARDGVDPAFSPDGRYVVFVRPSRRRPGSVLIVPADGGDAKHVPGATADELDWQPIIRPAAHGCTLNPGAHVVARRGTTIVATRIAATTFGIPTAQVWIACQSPRSRPRVLWIAGGDGDFTPLDGLSSFGISGRWVAFVVNANNGDHEGPPGGTLSIRLFDTATGGPSVSSASFDYEFPSYPAAIDQLAVDSAGDVAWIATATLPIPADLLASPMDQVGLSDAHGVRVLAQDNPGDLTMLALSGTQLTWRDRGQAQAASVAAR